MILLDYPHNLVKFILASLSVFFCKVNIWKITKIACHVKCEASEFEVCHVEQRLLQLHQQNHCLWMCSYELHNGVRVWAGRCTASPKSAVSFLWDILFLLKVKNTVFSQVSSVHDRHQTHHTSMPQFSSHCYGLGCSPICKNCNSCYYYWLGCFASLVLGIIYTFKASEEVTIARKALSWPLLSWVRDPSANIKSVFWTRIPDESGQGLPSDSLPVVQHDHLFDEDLVKD